MKKLSRVMVLDLAYNAKCQACVEKRVHTVREWKEYHHSEGVERISPPCRRRA
jgi:hypothetical protein